MSELRHSRCAFVVMKFLIRNEPHFMMRRDPSWNDVSFLGGHIEDRDNGLLERTAMRELLEEVPPLRSFRDFELHSLTEELKHGPLFSPSAGRRTLYDIQFFSVVFQKNPSTVLAAIGPRSANLLLPQVDLLEQRRFRIALLAQVLNQKYVGGLQAIPLSWPESLDSLALKHLSAAQSNIAFT